MFSLWMFLLGIFLGSISGFITVTLCIAAKRGDKQYATQENHQSDVG